MPGRKNYVELNQSLTIHPSVRIMVVSDLCLEG